MANALTAILITLDVNHEGGYQDNPRDRANWTGGEVGVGKLVGTNGGITALDMPGVDIKNLTLEQKIAYYTANYWKPFYSQITSQIVANKLFDMGVLFGIGTAVKILQEIFSRHGIVADGVFGERTLEIVNTAEPNGLLAAFKAALKAHAEAIAASNPNDAPDLSDWLRRIDS